MKLANLYRVTLTGLLVCTFSAHGQQGSTNVEKRVDSILSQMTLDEKLSYISGVGFPTSPGGFNIKPIPHLGLPEIFGSDRVFEEGLAQGREGRARGLHEILGPGVDFYRTSLGGRSFEYMTGEDPLIGAVLLAAEVKGMQSQEVMATTKHYACNDQEINRLAINVVVDERMLREIYLPPNSPKN